jgi:hypothetical protein
LPNRYLAAGLLKFNEVIGTGLKPRGTARPSNSALRKQQPAPRYFESVMRPVRRLDEPDGGRTIRHLFDNGRGGLLKSINPPT